MINAKEAHSLITTYEPTYEELESMVQTTVFERAILYSLVVGEDSVEIPIKLLLVEHIGAMYLTVLYLARKGYTVEVTQNGMKLSWGQPIEEDPSITKHHVEPIVQALWSLEMNHLSQSATPTTGS